MAQKARLAAQDHPPEIGGLLDHSTDALFCTVGLGALAWTGVVPVALPCLVAAAFVQYVLDSRSITGQPLRASFLGRWNGIFYFVPLLVISVSRLGLPRNTVALLMLAAGSLCYALVASTVVSVVDRAIAAKVSKRG